MSRFSPWAPDLAASLIAEQAHRKGALLPILHALNETFGHVPDAAVPLVAEALNLSRADVHGVLTFYHDFRREPPPAHRIRLCRAEACQARGGEALAAHVEARARSAAGVEVEAVYCLGLCASGPSAMIDERPVARLTPARIDALLAELGS
jgi:formate dehydrogenase subunit gamma